MSREHYKSDQYFTEYIAEEEKRAEKFRGMMPALKAEEQRVQCARYLAAFEKNILTAKYSRGASKAEIALSFGKYLEALEKCGISAYAEMADVLSLAILLGCPREDMKKTLANPEFDDALILALKRYIIAGVVEVPGASEKGLRFEDEYRAFLSYLVSEGEDAARKFVAYIEEKWYPSCSNMSWYDGHKSRENIYAGYWCWPAAALLKMKGDGAAAAGTVYIPEGLI